MSKVEEARAAIIKRALEGSRTDDWFFKSDLETALDELIANAREEGAAKALEFVGDGYVSHAQKLLRAREAASVEVLTILAKEHKELHARVSELEERVKMLEHDVDSRAEGQP
jgi:gamma-glutamyl:cysteine ligase YbdK (ATP-grasp superfamily)